MSGLLSSLSNVQKILVLLMFTIAGYMLVKHALKAWVATSRHRAEASVIRDMLARGLDASQMRDVLAATSLSVPPPDADDDDEPASAAQPPPAHTPVAFTDLASAAALARASAAEILARASYDGDDIARLADLVGRQVERLSGALATARESATERLATLSSLVNARLSVVRVLANEQTDSDTVEKVLHALAVETVSATPGAA